MKVLHFSFDDGRSGPARSAVRLHHGLKSLRVDLKMLVRKKHSQDPSIIQAAAGYEQPFARIVQDYYIQFQRTSLTNTCFSLGYPGFSCDHEKIVQAADILVFHWIADFLSPIETNNLLNLGKPIVWVCHDMRAFTGGCHYTAGCRQFTEVCRVCPQLKVDPFHVVEANFRDQLEIFRRNPITIVAPSRWMAQEARESAIFHEAPIKTIPYGLEENIFRLTDQKEARITLGLEPDSFVILLACSNAEEERKGLSYLEALSYALLRDVSKKCGDDVKYKIIFLFIGTKTNMLPHLAFPSKHLQFVQDDQQLQQAYAAADVLLHLSKEDNLPNMVLEAMACGVPVVGFDTGGVSDLIVDKKNGFLVPLGDIAALSARLSNVLLNSSMKAAMGKASRILVETKFTLRHQAKAHVNLYEDLLEKQAPLKRKPHLNSPLRIEKIIPSLFSIAESINRFIEIERTSCAEQLKALAAQYEVQNGEEKVAIKIKSKESSFIASSIRNVKKYFRDKTQSKFKHPDYYLAFDAPRHITHQRKHEGRGWVFHRHGMTIEKIRFKIGDKIFNGFVGYLRPDVALHYKQRKGSYDCGMKAPIELNFGINEIVIEVLAQEGEWQPIGRVKVLCNPMLSIVLLLPKKGWGFLHLLKKRNIGKNIASVVQHCLHYSKAGGIGHLNHYDPRPITYEAFPKSGFKVQDKKPKISIVTPSYNQGNFLEKTIQSILHQNYPNLEYVVIDGGSKDNSSQVIEKYQSVLSFSISEPDQGQSDAIQKGFSKCSGEEDDIMAYLNSDDLLLPGSLDFVASYFKKHPRVDMIYGHRILINDSGEEIGRWFTPRHNNYNLSVLDYVPQETMFWRRRVYDKIGGIDPNFHFAMDWDFLLRVQESGAVIKRVPYFLGCFRIHEQQKTKLHLTTIGDQEVQQLRERSHGEKMLPGKITMVHVKNLIDSGIAQALFSMGIRI